ncbi:MAG: WecB/TagA/CpsF family glycosyltransferase [bacterium]|nr:WecB/TagA/CpsF family glycosyltransferase [bacterium]
MTGQLNSEHLLTSASASAPASFHPGVFLEQANDVKQPVVHQQEVETVSIWGTEFARCDMQATVRLVDTLVHHGAPSYLVTANLNYLMLTADLPQLHEVNRHAAAVLADGFPILLKSRFSSRPLPERVAGADLIVELARLSANRGYRMFFLGGSEGVARAAAARLVKQFPALQIAGCYAPPFRKLSAAEQADLFDRIRGAQPAILLVAFGQPKGELWIYEHHRQLGVPLSIQLGASFDFLAGQARRAPKAWQRLGCEWLYRALSDPKRLVPRYTRNACFLARVLLRDAWQGCIARRHSVAKS